MYVALTRARDRLYLASTLKEGAFVPGRGSLAEVLRQSLKVFFAGAANVFNEVDTIALSGLSGREYTWRLCRVSEAQLPVAASVGANGDAPFDDFAPPAAAAERPRLSTADQVADADTADVAAIGPASDRLLGILVHRLFEHGDPEANAADAIDLCRRLLRAEERIALDDTEALLSRAVDVWVSARGR